MPKQTAELGQDKLPKSKGHNERIAAIAREYAKSPGGTLVVSPDNRSRSEINLRIHDELQSRGLVNRQDHSVRTLLRGDGEQTTYDPRRQVGVSVYREDEKRFSVGDRIQFTAPSQELKIANRDLGTVESIGLDGTMRLRLDDERKVEFNPQQHPHVDHGMPSPATQAKARLRSVSWST